MPAAPTVLLLFIFIGQADDPVRLDPPIRVPARDPVPGEERRIQVIEHEDRRFDLSRAFGVRFRAGPSFLFGRAETNVPGVARDEASFADDLQLDRPGTHLDGSILFRPWPHAGFEIRAQQDRWEGSGQAGEAFRFGAMTVPAGSRVSSSLRLISAGVHLDYDLGRWARGYHGFRAGARYFRIDESVRAAGDTVRNRIESALPFFGYRGGLGPFRDLHLDAEVSFFPSFPVEEGTEEDRELRVTAFAELRVAARWEVVDGIRVGLDYDFLSLFLEKRAEDDGAVQFEEAVLLGRHAIAINAEARF